MRALRNIFERPDRKLLFLASAAGFAFGKVFQKSSSILASASLHALIDFIKYAFF